MSQPNRKNSFTGNIISMAVMGLILVVLFFVVRTFIVFIYKFALLFLIIALIANYKVVTGYVKSIFDLLKREPMYGVGAIALSAVFYPVVFLVLMVRALMGRSIGSFKSNAGGIYSGQSDEREVYSDYEEIIEDELELKEMEKRKRE